MNRKMEGISVPRGNPTKASTIRRLNPAILFQEITKGKKFLNSSNFNRTIKGTTNYVVAIRGIVTIGPGWNDRRPGDKGLSIKSLAY